MNRRFHVHFLFLLVGFVLVLALAGCYHATITTGLPSSGQAKTTWAHSWIYGLVPPSVVKAESECSNGVAQVETQLTFVNGLVGSLTWGIYTPMQIKVTCASSRMSARVDRRRSVVVQYGSDYGEIMEAFSKAADMTVNEEKPAYVVFTEDVPNE